ncbi:MAG: helicase-related protein, partial [Stellaceae bacterium]
VLTSMLQDGAIRRALVFTRTKHTADRVAQHLERAGLSAGAIHGNKSQNARQRALGDFRDGRTRVLVATDIAARGIDIDGITHVFNFELPNVAESYVHRIGRTARAGASGVSISLCDASERGFLADIERLTKRKLAVIPYRRASADSAADAKAPPQARRDVSQMPRRSGPPRSSRRQHRESDRPSHSMRPGRKDRSW